MALWFLLLLLLNTDVSSWLSGGICGKTVLMTSLKVTD